MVVRFGWGGRRPRWAAACTPRVFVAESRLDEIGLAVDDC